MASSMEEIGPFLFYEVTLNKKCNARSTQIKKIMSLYYINHIPIIIIKWRYFFDLVTFHVSHLTDEISKGSNISPQAFWAPRHIIGPKCCTYI